MNGLKFITQKQLNWARRQNLKLIAGNIENDGEKAYLQDVAENLFSPLTQESSESYNAGDGNEIKDSDKYLAKMKAVYSSSAIVVNLFQYWQGKDLSPLMHALNLRKKHQADILIENIGADAPKASEILPKKVAAKINFEKKFTIGNGSAAFPRAANIDVVIEEPLCHTAIESKFTEPYIKWHKGLSETYLKDASLWKRFPHLYNLAKQISPDNQLFKYLDAAQFIKHILGLSANYPRKDGKINVKFRLLYLWYDVLGADGAEHRKEIERFAEIAQKDDIDFLHISYQEVIVSLSQNYYEGNESYIDYLTERYL